MGPPYPEGVEQCGPNGSDADLPVMRQYNLPHRPRCEGSARPSLGGVGVGIERDNRDSAYATPYLKHGPWRGEPCRLRRGSIGSVLAALASLAVSSLFSWYLGNF